MRISLRTIASMAVPGLLVLIAMVTGNPVAKADIT